MKFVVYVMKLRGTIIESIRCGQLNNIKAVIEKEISM